MPNQIEPEPEPGSDPVRKLNAHEMPHPTLGASVPGMSISACAAR